MKISLFLTIFWTVFLAEVGDKTQLATLFFTTQNPSAKLTVFLAASAALALSCAIGVLIGSVAAAHINETTLRYIAGIAFIAIGLWTLYAA